MSVKVWELNKDGVHRHFEKVIHAMADMRVERNMEIL